MSNYYYARPGLFSQHPAFDRVENIAVRCVLRAFGEAGPFAGGQFAVKVVEQAVEHVDLAGIHRGTAE